MEATSEQKDQLKKFSAERDTVVAELHISGVENKRLSLVNKKLVDEVRVLEDKKFKLEKDLDERGRLLTGISKNRAEISQLMAVKESLNKDILTLQEKNQVNVWSAKRDAFQAEILELQSRKESFELINKNLSDSNTDIETRINESSGRILEIAKKEKELTELTNKELAGLDSRKKLLEFEVSNLSKIIDILTDKKTSLEKDVSFALSALNIVKGENLLLEKVIGHVAQVSDENIRKMNNLMSDLSKNIEEIISINKKNVSETNVVIEKLPKMLVEIQKRGLIRNKI